MVMTMRFAALCLFVGVASAATFRGRAPASPMGLAHKEGCYIEEIKDVIPYNSMITPQGYCYRIECSAGLISYASCGVIFSDDPNCHKTETDLTKPYPDCCPTIKCESENRI